MAYERELDPLRAWLAKHPGLNVTALKKTIQYVPWPDGPLDAWAPPYDGTRLDLTVPSIASLDWKLRYLELMGDARQERGKWFLVPPNHQIGGASPPHRQLGGNQTNGA